MKFTKRPVVVDAWLWDGDWARFMNQIQAQILVPDKLPPFAYDPAHRDLSIMTLEGTMHVALGDWVIRGVKGEYYPCKPDIFSLTYYHSEEKAPNAKE